LLVLDRRWRRTCVSIPGLLSKAQASQRR
jgi:hypothetical protein